MLKGLKSVNKQVIRHIFLKIELDKACFKHDSAYAGYKDLLNRTRADKVFKDKAYEIATDPKYDGYQRGLAAMVYKFFDKKTSGSEVKRAERTQRASGAGNVKLADELHKPVIKKFNERKVYSSFKDNIWRVDLADMQLLSRQNKGVKYLLCAVDLFSKYAFVIPLKDKKGASVVEGFKKIVNKSNR